MSVLFNGATQIISIADNAKFTFAPVTDTRTFSVYWKSTSLPNANGEYQVLFLMNNASGNKIQFAVANNAGTNLIIATVHDVAFATLGAFYSLLPSVTSDTWYHIVFGLSTNNNCFIYWEGVSQTVYYSSWDDTTSINPTSITINNGFAIYDNMTISHVTWLTGLLTVQQILDIKSNPYLLDDNSTCLLHLPLLDGTGTTAYDYQTQNTATNGTLTNSPTWSDSEPIYGFVDILSLQRTMWAWEYGSGTGDQDCPVTEDTRVCSEIFTTDATVSSTYSDGNLHEDTFSRDSIEIVEATFKTVGVTQGTFGYGIWSGNVTNDMIWFWWGDNNNDAILQGLRVQVVDGGSLLLNQQITTVDTTEWHTYRIVRGSGYAVFYVDSSLVASYVGSMPSGNNMRIELWVDNAYYQSGTRYLETITHRQSMFIDKIVNRVNSQDTGWTNISKFNGVAVASISKINGVAVANISKINGVSV